MKMAFFIVLIACCFQVLLGSDGDIIVTEYGKYS